MIKIGIDLGGTKIEGIALSEAGNALFRHRVSTPQGDYQGTLHSIAELISLIEAETGKKVVSVSVPPALYPHLLVC